MNLELISVRFIRYDGAPVDVDLSSPIVKEVLNIKSYDNLAYYFHALLCRSNEQRKTSAIPVHYKSVRIKLKMWNEYRFMTVTPFEYTYVIHKYLQSPY